MRSRVGLTLFLLSPLAVVGVIVGWIFVSYGEERAMRAPAVGAGVGDTGGANAIGQWLAGRDAEAIEARAQAVRTGAGVRPEELSGAQIRVLMTEPPLEPGETLRLVIDGAKGATYLPLGLHPEGGYVLRLVPGMIEPDAAVRFERGDGGLVQADEAGEPARFAPLPLVSKEASGLLLFGKIDLIDERDR